MASWSETPSPIPDSFTSKSKKKTTFARPTRPTGFVIYHPFPPLHDNRRGTASNLRDGRRIAEPVPPTSYRWREGSPVSRGNVAAYCKHQARANALNAYLLGTTAIALPGSFRWGWHPRIKIRNRSVDQSTLQPIEPIWLTWPPRWHRLPVRGFGKRHVMLGSAISMSEQRHGVT